MTRSGAKTPFVAIACGGTGGHLFPGLAVAGELKKRGCQSALLISPKDIDQQAVKTARAAEIFTLPAVGLQNRNYFSFAGSFCKIAVRRAENFPSLPTATRSWRWAGLPARRRSWRRKCSAPELFCTNPTPFPAVQTGSWRVLWMKRLSAFPKRLPDCAREKSLRTGTPVRPQFSAGRDSVESKLQQCRTALGLEPNRPTILIMGGSQGASGINEIILATLPYCRSADSLSANSAVVEHADRLPRSNFFISPVQLILKR